MNQLVNYKRHRYPPHIIAHAVWVCFRFPLSFRLVEELLAARGIIVSYETIRCWAKKFGPEYARHLKRKPRAGTTSGTLTRSSSALLAGNTGCGERWTRMAMFSTRSCSPAQHQGGEAPSDTVAAKARYEAEADHHRQAAILRRSERAGHAQRRAPIAQRPEQSGRERACATAKTGTHDATISISRSPSTFRLDLLRRQKSLRPAPLETLCSPHPNLSPKGHSAVEGRYMRSLNLTDSQGHSGQIPLT